MHRRKLLRSHRPNALAGCFQPFCFPTKVADSVSGTYAFPILDLSFPTAESERIAMVQTGFEMSGTWRIL